LTLFALPEQTQVTGPSAALHVGMGSMSLPSAVGSPGVAVGLSSVGSAPVAGALEFAAVDAAEAVEGAAEPSALQPVMMSTVARAMAMRFMGVPLRTRRYV